MKLCVSNIAWNKEENNNSLKILKKYNINAIDVAPTLLFDSLDNLSDEMIERVREYYHNKEITIIGMQSLLYGFSYSLFDGEEERNEIKKYLSKIFRIANLLGIKVLIFGSPKNRYIKKYNENIEEIAIIFFREICELASKYDLDICLEANPKEYDCNFITNTFEAINLINKVNKNNFLLNFDTSTILLNKNNFKEAINYANKLIRHVHISSPFIKGIYNMDHKNISNLLNSINYEGYVSLEMKPNLTENNLKNLEENVEIFKRYYG